MTVIAVCQLGLAIGDVDANRAAAAAAVSDAAARGAALVVLPELCDSGYVFASTAEARQLAAPAAQNPTLQGWQVLAASHGVVVVGGFCELGGDGELYNSAAIVDGSGPLAVYRKAHLWDRERLVFTPGDDAPPVVDLPFGRVATMVCYDLEFPEWVRLPALAGADLIAAPVNWPVMPETPGMPVPSGERPTDIVRVQAAACANGVFIAVADRCRRERNVDWVGGTVIVRPDGYPAALPRPGDHELLLTADCDLARAKDKTISDHNDVLADRRPELYQRVSRPRALADP
jgi:predicted amidohydrolase